jgi:hypothetical protein
VQVIKNDKKFEWASVMLFNCEKCQVLTPEYVETTTDKVHWLEWAKEEDIGGLPSHWNHLVGYDEPSNDVSLIHYTQGIPAFPETRDSEHAESWNKELRAMNSSVPWIELMGRSVHATVLDGQIVPKYRAKNRGAMESKNATA